MEKTLKYSGYRVLHAFVIWFILCSALLRIVFYLGLHSGDIPLSSMPLVMGKGLIYDFAVALFLSVSYCLYLLVLPKFIWRSRANRGLTYMIILLMVTIAIFSFFSEYIFWQEFQSRFNFIAVDYLIYTFEVVNNINQSYPLYILVPSVLLMAFLVTWAFARLGYFRHAFRHRPKMSIRMLYTVGVFGILSMYSLFLDNSWAESSRNRYVGELSKAGIYSFFSAFRDNELSYEKFYPLIPRKKAFSLVRSQLMDENTRFVTESLSIVRNISNGDSQLRPNVIMVVVESLSASFMERFGNKARLMPNLDSLASKGAVFLKMYATGTRTVRGMEALTLAVPPTPGNSIVRRSDNGSLATVGTIFRGKGYTTSFFYGGDGYFDNMNQYFGSNGFDIIDNGKKIFPGDSFATKRTLIPEDQISFKNAWGICDEDLYGAVLRQADKSFGANAPFYSFVMTTSNHRPFTYPSGKIDIPSGSGREGAVKYSDYAIGELMRQAAKKPWFANTIFIFVGDHCASSAGKNEIEVEKYHIPAIIYNLPGTSGKTIDPLCSQIDLYPTLLGMMGWDYSYSAYGMDVRSATYNPRAFVATYQKLGYLKNGKLVILGPKRTASTYTYDLATGSQNNASTDSLLLIEAIANYQSAYQFYKRGGLKERIQSKQLKH